MMRLSHKRSRRRRLCQGGLVVKSAWQKCSRGVRLIISSTSSSPSSVSTLYNKSPPIHHDDDAD
eukprot:5238738-Ditylum_brightwellii.AAC.1